MKNNKPDVWWLGNGIVSVMIPFVCMFLMSMSLPPNNSGLFFFWYAMPFVFGIPAFFLSLFLFFVLDLGLSKLWNDAPDVKILGLALIISAVLVPFVWAIRAGANQISSPIPWWLIPLSASLILLIWSSISFAWAKRAEHNAKKA